jgi:hypothetical protein
MLHLHFKSLYNVIIALKTQKNQTAARLPPKSLHGTAVFFLSPLTPVTLRLRQSKTDSSGVEKQDNNNKNVEYN